MSVNESRPDYRWEKRGSADEGIVHSLSVALNDVPLPLARALVLRGVTTFEEARKYFRPSLDEMHDPFLMKDMEQAAERLAEAVLTHEKVLVYGDYDVDGVTSTVMMTSFLRDLGVDVEFFIPHRSKHGYGLCNAGFDFARARDCSLVVALDCGITAIEPAAYAKSIGLDLIICDHHTAIDEIPDAVAVLDPKRPDCEYPYPHLSGCGVGFKLAQATTTLLGEDPEKTKELMDLVAISIAADIVPMTGENRKLMRGGTELLCNGKTRLGIAALAKVARLNLTSITTSQIVFGIAPRINAAGRLGDAGDAATLLLETDSQLADKAASAIEKVNDERKQIDRNTEEEAVRQAQTFVSARARDAFVLFSESWHPGVIGITASRIVEKFFRPTVMLTKVNGTAKGSARSIHGVNVYNALKECSDLFITFGGHDFAAGMQLELSVIDEFRERFEAAVARQLTDELRQPAIRTDSEIHLDAIDDRFWAILRQFDPFGPSNSRPVFVASGLRVVGAPRLMGSTGDHIKFAVRPIVEQERKNRPLDVVGFGMKSYFSIVQESQKYNRPLEMAFTLDENDYRGTKTIQARLKDIRFTTSDASVITLTDPGTKTAVSKPGISDKPRAEILIDGRDSKGNDLQADPENAASATMN